MAAQVVVQADTPAGGILNENWWAWGNQWLNYIQNPDLIGLDTYELMLQTDETLASGVEFISMAALAKLGDYSHPDAVIQRFVRRAIERMEGSWTEAVAEILTALWAGFSVTEIIWRFEAGEVVLDHLQTLHPASVTFDIHREGSRKNRLKTAYQWLHQGQQVEIPIEKAIIYSHRKRFGNPYGQSRFRSAYKSWFYKDVIMKSWGIAMERYGSPHAVAQVANPSGVVNVAGVEYTVMDYMTRALEGLSAKGSMAVDGSTEVKLFQAARSVGNDFEGFVAYCNKMMYRALGLPSLIADHGGGTGSYSLGQKHFDLFVLMLEQLLDDLIEQLVEQLVRRLVDYNFGQQDDYGTFLVEDFQTDDLKLVSEVLKNLAETGVIDVSHPDDLNEMRERVGFPARNEEEISLPAPEQPDLEQQPAPEEGMMSNSLAGRKRKRVARRAAERRLEHSQRPTPGEWLRETILAG